MLTRWQAYPDLAWLYLLHDLTACFPSTFKSLESSKYLATTISPRGFSFTGLSLTAYLNLSEHFSFRYKSGVDRKLNLFCDVGQEVMERTNLFTPQYSIHLMQNPFINSLSKLLTQRKMQY